MAKRSGVVDGDGHVVERAEDLEPFGWDAPCGVDALDNLLSIDIDGVGAIQPKAKAGSRDPERRLRDMDLEGIEVAVNYPTASLMINQIGPEAGLKLSRAYDSWFAATYRAVDPDRYWAMAPLHLGDVEGAIAECKRAVSELGAPGIMVSPYWRDVHLDDPSLDGLWATAQELDVPVGIHGGRATTAPHLLGESFREQKRYYVMAHPFGQMVAMGDLVLGGVLERFPRLRVVFLEAGIGWIPWYIDRLDEAFESVDGQRSEDLEREPSDYLLSGNCYFSCEPDEPNLATSVSSLGESQVIFASDYPHFDCDFPNTVSAIEHSGLSDTTLDKILTTNPKALYRI
jgi:predicted TIM-barrel fold metal-dependent hydrolase